jgi:ABC-type transport system involved in multi-copper enzyme maturation permease subunit
VNPIFEVGLVLARELRKSLRSVKGLILLTFSLLGGTAVSLLLVKAEQLKHSELHDASPEAMRELQEQLLTKVYNDPEMGKYLSEAPYVLLAILGVTVWLAPLLIALLGFDSVAGDVQHRTVRYWTVRTRRASYMVGKFAGLWAVVALITFLMHLFIWVVVIARGDATFGSTISWGLRFWAVTLPISAAWCGIATLVGSLFRTPLLALLTTFGVFFVMWLVWFIGVVSRTDAMLYVYPNYYDAFLLSPKLDRLSIGVASCAAFAVASMGLCGFLFTKKDV